MRVIVPPVVVGDRICRIVSAVESLLEVEEWVGQWWAPSSVTLSDASHAPAADAVRLRARGVPPEDYAFNTPRPGGPEIQALLQARDPARVQDMLLNDEVMRSNPPRRRSVAVRRGAFYRLAVRRDGIHRDRQPAHDISVDCAADLDG